jgi:hypothetical protein
MGGMTARMSAGYRWQWALCAGWLVLVAVVAAGCGGDSGGSSTHPAGEVTISGTAVQGPMTGSTVTAYSIDPATGASLQALGTATSDASWQVRNYHSGRFAPGAAASEWRLIYQ